MKNLTVERPSERVALISLGSHERMAIIDPGLMEALEMALDELAGDASLGAVVITGGGRVFIAGADIKYMSKVTRDEAESWAACGQRVAEKIENFPVPVIAAINGAALGGGFEMALACDFRLAAESAVMGSPEISLGIVCGWGGTQRLTHLAGVGWAKYLTLTGERISAAEASAIGLVQKVYPDGELKGAALTLAEKIALYPREAAGTTKRLVNMAHQVDQRQALRQEGEALAEFLTKSCGREGLGAFVEKRKPNFNK